MGRHQNLYGNGKNSPATILRHAAVDAKRPISVGLAPVIEGGQGVNHGIALGIFPDRQDYGEADSSR